MNKFIYNFVKITGWPVQLACFRTKVYYENKQNQSRKIKGPAIIVSNHTAISDFMILMYVFKRNIHCVMAEVLYKKNKFMNWFLPKMGGIKVDRDTKNYSFIEECCNILKNNGVVEIFPEARIPKPHEKRPLEFKPSAAYIALLSGAPIIPVFTNGSYYKKKRARVLIGDKIDVKTLIDNTKSEKENIETINTYLRNKIMELGNDLEQRTKEEKRKK